MKKVFIQVTAVAPADVSDLSKGLISWTKWVNMSRVQEIDPASCINGAPETAQSVLTMNIPACWVACKETPDEIIGLLNDANQED